MSSIEHVVLYLILFGFYFLWGKDFSNIKDSVIYWTSAAIPILLYSLVVGTRYGWGVDYMSYKERLENAFTYDEAQVGFRFLNQFIKSLGVNYVAGFMVYSFIFILCSFILIRSYKQESKYMYAFLIPATLLFTTGIIRQGVAISFFFLAIYFLNNKQWRLTITAIIIGATIHIAIVIPFAIIMAFYFLTQKPLNWKITIPIYLFFTFIFDVSTVAFFSKYLQYISLDSKFQSYIDNSDLWFGTEAVSEKYEQSTIALVSSAIFDTGIIYIGFIALKIKSNRNIVYIYNTVVFGLISLRAVFLFEILKRFVAPLVMLYFIVLGYSIYTITNRRKFVLMKILSLNDKIKPMRFPQALYRVGITFILVHLLLYFGRFIFFNPNAQFYWNQ